MHGHSLVNAEVDSMGGVIDVGVGVDSKTSPRRAAIEKAQAELRQEFDVREERRRELEFLEKGGNPLDFKLGLQASISVQSTSLTDQLAEQCVISEAKGSFVLTASPHGDSVESSGRPGVSLGREPNSADNLLLFDGENEILDRDKNAIHPSRGNVAPSEQSSQLDGNHNAKESKGQAYIRRNRSRSNRDSSDLVPVVHGNGNSILPSSRHDLRDAKGLLCEEHTEKDHTVSSICNSKPTSPNGKAFSKTMTSDNQLDPVLAPLQAQETTTDVTKVRQPEYEAEISLFKNSLGNDQNQESHGATEESPNMTFAAPGFVGERKEGVPAVLESAPCAATENTEKIITISQMNGFNTPNIDGNDLQNECQISGNSAFDTVATSFNIKNLDVDSSCAEINHNIDVNIVSEQCQISRRANGGSNGNSKEHTSAGERAPHIPESYKVKENNESKAIDVHAINDDLQSVHGNHKNRVILVKIEEENRSDLQNEVKPLNNIEGVKSNDQLVSKLERKNDNLSGENSPFREMASCPQDTLPSISVTSNCELSLTTFSGRGSATAPEVQKNQNCTEGSLKFVTKEREDAILEEARTIEANLRRAGQLSVSTSPFEKRRKSHWDFVLEEMAWLANDFMQERVWKITAAAQMCHWVAFTGRLKFDEENLRRKQRKVACTLATAIMQFWHSAEVLLKSDDPSFGVHEEHKSVLFRSRKVDGVEVIEDKNGEPNMETGGYVVKQNSGRTLQRYAVRFLKYISSLDRPVQAEAPATPDRLSDSGILEMSWDQLSEESLFYPVPSGAMEVYMKSVESHWAQYEKIGNNMQQEEFETSIHDSAAEIGTRENAYEEEEGETGMYYVPGSFEGNKSSKFAQRKRRNLQKSYSARQYEIGADLPYGHCLESKLNQPSLITGKRPSNSLNVGSIPTKRVRTAARQRVVSPYGAGATGGLLVANKTDVSSGDTSSFQDDQSTLHGGSQPKKAMEVESTGDFGRQLPFDIAEISAKPKKKKKAMHLGYKNSLNSTDAFIISGKGPTYDQRWQLDSAVQNEQRDHSKKRLESHHLESNGNSGLYGQHAPKKPKILKQLADASAENIPPVTGSISSPVASQMSNMSNPNKLLRMIANRDRGRKNKMLKVSAGQSGSGSPWSLFEDQALVVLVHDMGPNWELVSDAINSTLQFKCIFRKPRECKERHKILMDRNANDGADSAEDSGSSQPYPSTLPGIPKGSARQLFQRLQGPLEEDTLKTHFEKIILIGQQQHSRRSQNDNQELKQIAPVHNSHVIALSQACPNGLSGGPLTPLDLCDATTSSLDVISTGYQGPHTSNLAIANHQGSVAPVVPTSGANSMLQGSSGVVLGSSLPLPSSALNAPARDAQRYGVPRPASLAIDEQQRMQHYNQMLSGRNIPQSSLAVPGPLPVGADRGVRMLPGGNGMGMMCGMNRGLSMPRPGFQGMGSPAMLNMVSSGSMLSSSGVGIPSPGAVSGQGSSMLRPRDTLHMLRPGQIQNPDDQRQMMMQELQMQQVTQGNNSQGGVAPPYSGLTTSFSNQTVPSPVQTFPIQHQQQQHQMAAQQPHVLGNPHHLHQGANPTPQQQAYAMRLAERQLQQQQRFLHQQQQQQHAMSPLQNTSQIQQQPSSHSVSLQNSLAPSSSPMAMNPIPSQTQQKQNHMSHGLGRGSLPTNQMLKQRHRHHQLQQQQQQPRQHPHHTQQRQQPAGKQLIKGLGRGGGSMMMHQNIPVVDGGPHVNGLSTGTVNQVSTEKGEQVMHMMQGQGLFPGSGSSTAQPGKSNQSQQQQQQQKLFSRPPPAKQVLPMSSHPDNSNKGQAQVPSSDHTLLASQQSVPSPLQQRQTSQSQQTIQRMIHQNRQMGSDAPLQSPSDQVNAGFQMGVSANIPQSTAGSTPDSTGAVPVVSSTSALSPSQWKSEVIYDTNAQGPNAHLAPTTVKNSPQSNLLGSEPLPSSSQGLLAQRQFSGSLPIHGQWQQQQQQQHHHHRQAGQQGVLYTRPSNSGSG